MASSQQTSKMHKGMKFDDDAFEAPTKTKKCIRRKPEHKSYSSILC